MSTSGNSNRSGRGGRGRGRSSYRGGYRPNNNNNNNSTSQSTDTTGSTNEKTKYLMGNRGSESYRKVNEELLIEANTKYGADMGHIMLNEEVPPFPIIELAKPRLL